MTPQFQTTSVVDVGTIILSRQRGQRLRQRCEVPLRRGDDVGLTDVIGAPQGHDRVPRCCCRRRRRCCCHCHCRRYPHGTPVAVPDADLPQKRIRLRRYERKLRQPRRLRLDQIIPSKTPIDRPGVPPEGQFVVPFPVSFPPIHRFVSSVFRQILQGIVTQDRLVLRDRPPFQNVGGIVRGRDPKGMSREGGRADGFHGGNGSHKGERGRFIL
mmetsp:Transcript_5786/g.12607  ORF Transcript_5786/g.12607 Transcript_5786/m.12607 type:complete len:213 (+) Transcript_5786:2643-3281(+)